MRTSPLEGPSRLRRSWDVIAVLGLAAVFLAPAISSGYWAEDLGQSLMPRASTVLLDQSLGDTVREHVKHTLLNGRFFPMTPALITTVHFAIRDVRAYKAYIVVLGVLDVFLFYLLARTLSGRRDFAGFAACLTVGLIQYRVAVDPSLGFFGQMQILIAALFLSLLTLQFHLEGRGRWLLASSVALFLGCALLYEVAYSLVPLHLCLVARGPEGWRRKLRTACPFLGVVAFCGYQTALIRWLHPSASYWHTTSFDPSGVARAIAYQTSAGLPMSYFLADPIGIFPGRDLVELFRWLGKAVVILVALSAFGLSYRFLKQPDEEAGLTPSGVGPGWLAILGLILAVFPSLMLSISPYHWASLSPGVGWIPVLIQDYGVGLLLSGGLWAIVRTSSGGGPGASWKCALVSLFVAMVVGVTYRANRDVVRCFNAEPGSRLYRAEVVKAGGGRDRERRLLEAALVSGLLDEVPDRSKVHLAHEYPHWYDPMLGRYFFAAYSGKALETVTPGAGPASADAYRVLDVLDGPDSGHVVLSWGGSDGAGLRLFVLRPGSSLPEFRLQGHAASDPGSPLSLDGRALPMVRSGQDWALFSLSGPGSAVAPESLRLTFGPERAASMARSGMKAEPVTSGKTRR